MILNLNNNNNNNNKENSSKENNKMAPHWQAAHLAANSHSQGARWAMLGRDSDRTGSVDSHNAAHWKARCPLAASQADWALLAACGLQWAAISCDWAAGGAHGRLLELLHCSNGSSSEQLCSQKIVAPRREP